MLLSETHGFAVQLNHVLDQLQATYQEIISTIAIHDEQHQSLLDTLGSTLFRLEQKTAADRAALLRTSDNIQAFELLGELFHQFRAPITSILGFSKLVLDYVPVIYPQQTAHVTQLLNDAETLNVVNCTILDWLQEHK